MGLFDDLVDLGEDVWEDGKRLVGEGVDGLTDLAGDGLDTLGFDGAADDVRDWGDSVADQLGATPDEQALGETREPRELVHGDPAKMRETAGKLDDFAADFTGAGEGLKAISAGEWLGASADSYHRTVDEEYPKWLTAGAACTTASSALTDLATAVEWAQQQAAEAIRLWDEADAQHAQWQRLYDAYASGASDTHPGADPGPTLREQANEVLTAARAHRNEAASTAATGLHDAAGDAPPMPDGSDRLLANLSDLYTTGQLFGSHALVGLTGAVTDLAKLLRTVNPTDPYNLAHPAQYAANTSGVAAGLINLAAHPDELIRGLVGTGWSEDPGQATGTFLANFIPFGPKGSGITRAVLSDAARTAPRTALGGVDDAVARGADDAVARGADDAVARGADDAVARGADDAVARGADDAAVRGESPETRATPSNDVGHADGPAAHTADAPAQARPESPATHADETRAPASQSGSHTGGAADAPAHTGPHTDSAPARPDPPSRTESEQPAVTGGAYDGPQHTQPAASPEPRPDAPEPSPRTPDETAHPDPAPQARPDEPTARGPEPDDPAPNRSYPQDHSSGEHGTAPDRSPDTPAARPADADAPPPRSDGDAPAPRTDGDAPAPRSDGDVPPPRSDGDVPAPRSDGDAPPPRSDADAPPPRTDADAPAPRSDGDTPAPPPRNDEPVIAGGAVHPAASPHVSPDGGSPRAQPDVSRPDVRDTPAARDAPPARDPHAARDGANARDTGADRQNQARPSATAPDARAPSPTARTADTTPAPADRAPSNPVTARTTGQGTHPANHGQPGDAMPAVPPHGRPGDGAGAPYRSPIDRTDHGGHTSIDPQPDGAIETAGGRDLADAADRPSAATEPSHRQLCGEPVDTATGEYLLPAVDLELPGVLPLCLSRTHRSQFGHGVWFGPSWTSTFDSRVVIAPDAVTTVDADGTMLLFDHPTVDEPTVARHGRPWRLWATATGGYRLEPPDAGPIHHFEPKPHLDGADVAAGALFISAITDRHRNRILFTYTGDGAPSGVVHSGGYRVGVTCDGRRIRAYTLATDSSTTVVRRFGYSDGNLASVTDGAGAVTRFAYDGARRMTGWTDSTGASYDNVYDDSGRVTSQTGPNGVWAGTFEYRTDADGRGRSTVYTDAVGARTVFGFDIDLGLRATADPVGRITRNDYNGDRRLLAVTDPAGASTTLRYTNDGHLTETVDPLGGTTVVRHAHTAAGARPAETVDAAGRVTTHSYDSNGNLVATRDPDGGEWQWEYSAVGAVTAQIDPLGRRIDVTCNAAGLPVRIVDGLGGETTIDYDAFGRRTRVVEADGSATVYGYDAEGRLLTRRAPDGATETWSYDGEGNTVSHTGPEGDVTRWEYGDFDKVTARIDGDGRTTYRYDKARRLVAVVNPAGLTWTFGYYPDGRVATETDFDGARIDYAYDQAGRLATRTNAVGQSVVSTYDAAGRKLAETSHGGPYAGERIEYAYDPTGRLLRASTASATVDFDRDANGRVIAETTDGRTVEMLRDAAGGLLRTTCPSGHTVVLSRDARGFVDTVTVGGHRCDVLTDAVGRTTRLQVGDVAVDSRWDGVGRLSQRAVRTGLRDMAALRIDDGDGRTETRTTAAAGYRYHRAGNLAAVDPVDGSAALGTPASYTTDAMGRLVTREPSGGVAERFAFDSSGNLDRPTGSAPTWRYQGTRLIDDGRSRYGYDRAGRVVTVSTRRLSRAPDVWHYEWDAWDRLRAVVTPDGQRHEYEYDAYGRRTAKASSDGTRIEFSWAGGQLVEQRAVSEQRKDEVTSWAYLPGGHTPLTQTSAHGVSEVDRRFYAIVTDHLDTPVAMLDPATGALAGRASSTAWGQTTWVGEASTPWRFPGQYADPETGLHYNVFRYYRPQAGRYLSPDPLGLAPAPNPYAYPPNPTALVDPWGLAPCPHPNRGVYDVYGETRLPRDMWLDSDPRQFQEANRQLYHQMRNDPALMARIEQSYPGTFEHVTPRRVGEGGYPESAFSRKPPPGLTWHHHEMPGLMRLVDRLDHNARHGDYHPTGRGGRAIWGGGSDNR